MAKQTARETEKAIIGLYMQKRRTQEIADIVGVSKRTVERKIRDYEEGNLPYCDSIAENVSQFEKEAELELLDMLKSEAFNNIIRFSLQKITPDRVDDELNTKGIRGVVTLVGTLIDKRLKSYSLELERENLKLQKELAKNSRKVIFMNEGEVYASSDELHEGHPKDIS